MAPEEVEASLEEGRDAGLDDGGLLLEILFPRGEKKNQFCVGQSPEPLEGVVRIEEEVAPHGVLEGRQLTPRGFGAVA